MVHLYDQGLIKIGHVLPLHRERDFKTFYLIAWKHPETH